MEVKTKYEEWHAQHGDFIDQKYYKWILKHVNPNQKDVIVDVACGKGYLLRFYENQGFCSFGIDLSKNALKEAKKNLRNSHLIQASAEYLPFSESSFSIVTCLGSAEHFSNPKNGIKEMSRVLVKMGRAYILLPNSYFLGHIYLVYRTGEPPDEGGQDFSESFATRKFWERFLSSNGLFVNSCMKYNRISEASKKLPASTRVLYNFFIAPILPTNLSYAFVFKCRKTDREIE